MRILKNTKAGATHSNESSVPRLPPHHEEKKFNDFMK